VRRFAEKGQRKTLGRGDLGQKSWKKSGKGKNLLGQSREETPLNEGADGLRLCIGGEKGMNEVNGFTTVLY